jgi:hypothetical protein
MRWMNYLTMRRASNDWPRETIPYFGDGSVTILGDTQKQIFAYRRFEPHKKMCAEA